MGFAMFSGGAVWRRWALALGATLVLGGQAWAQVVEAAKPEAPPAVVEAAPQAPARMPEVEAVVPAPAVDAAVPAPAAQANIEQGVHLSGDELVKAIVGQSSLVAIRELSSRMDFYWTVAAGIGTAAIALFAFLGVRQLSDLRKGLQETIVRDLKAELPKSSELQDSILRQLEEIIVTRIDEKVGGLERVLTLQQLQRLTEEIKEKSSFSNAERDVMISRLLDLQKDKQITASPEFEKALEAIVDNLFGAGLWPELDRVENEFAEKCLSTVGIATTYVQGYARQYLGEVHLDRGPFLREQLMKYCRALISLKYPERALGSLMAVEVMEKRPGWQDRLHQMVARGNDMTAQERDVMNSSVNRMCDASALSKNPDSGAYRIAGLYQELRNHLGPTFGLVLQPTEEKPPA